MIDTSINNGVYILSINRPEKKNAITQGMYSAMADALDKAVGDETVKVILIKSGNEHFSAGNDLGDFLDKPDIEENGPTWRFLTALMHCPVPVVAAVKGYAIGIGSTMLLHCEQVLVDETAIFSFPFINLGLVPEAGSSLLLPRLVGYQKAAHLFLTGETVNASDAINYGLASRLVDGDVDAAGLDYCEQLATRPRSSLLAIKALLRRDEEPLDARSQIELRQFVQSLSSDAAKEAMNAFLEKRKPDFKNL